jgi:hypothetical protein
MSPGGPPGKSDRTDQRHVWLRGLADGTWAGETGCVGAGIPVPLRVLLPCLAVGLVAFGAVAVGVAGVSGTGGYLMRRADSSLLGCAGSVLSGGVVAAPGSGRPSGQAPPPGACGWELLSASGQVLALAAPGAAAGPAIPVSGSWLAAHLTRPVTVPGVRAGGHWRIVIEAVHYWRIVVRPARYRLQRVPYAYGPGDVEYVISQRPGLGSSGMVVVMTGLAAPDRVTGRVLADYAAAVGAVLVLLAVAALAVTQAILRPLRQAAELADSAAARRFPRVMPRGGARAGAARRWPFGRALMTVPGQLRASQAAEAVARRSAEEMSKRLGETALELRRSVSIVRGFAEYRRQRPEPPAAGLDRMLRRVADEAARMEMLIDGLSRAHPQDPPEPGPRPARRAAGSGPPPGCRLPARE